MVMNVIITGGCGFIGVNTALRHLKKGDKVIILDNMSRKGTEINLKLLRSRGKFEFYKMDIRNFNKVNEIFRKNRNSDLIYHFAAQVAVTTSIVNQNYFHNFSQEPTKKILGITYLLANLLICSNMLFERLTCSTLLILSQ